MIDYKVQFSPFNFTIDSDVQKYNFTMDQLITTEF